LVIKSFLPIFAKDSPFFKPKSLTMKNFTLILFAIVFSHFTGLQGQNLNYDYSKPGAEEYVQQLQAEKEARIASSHQQGNQVIPPERGATTVGETIYDAFTIGSLPFTGTGNTCSYIDDYDVACPWTGYAPDVVFSYSPASDEIITITTCDIASYDTKIYVFENTENNTVACNDDYSGCLGFTSQIDDLTVRTGNTYFIVLDGYGSSCGDYEIDVFVTGTPPPPPPPMVGDVIEHPFIIDAIPFVSKSELHSEIS
jgi:hypothetical protein